MGSERSGIPPGQAITEKFPVLHYGPIPSFNEEEWDLRVFGLVEEPLRLSYKEFRELPAVTVVSDIHCVTGWSRLANVWEGVLFSELLQHIRLKSEAKYVMVHCDGGYTTNLPLEVMLDDDVLFAYRHNGADLTPEHGRPLRLVVPKRYFWKSAKWVRALEFMPEDQLGFWEQRGYHNNADPWKEERYSNQTREDRPVGGEPRDSP
ncbi:MAG: sulfite oxidase-like oxidoreductase [Chloroflexi bacterium]|nr:sulfite oxidase-like oxidoreductase [Chloroflexota bacterium]MCL5076034.1 sulfite oxidase-like oxidoreductase [Chloroflexota bacterium]